MAASPPGARSKISDSVFKNPGIYIYIYIIRNVMVKRPTPIYNVADGDRDGRNVERIKPTSYIVYWSWSLDHYISNFI